MKIRAFAKDKRKNTYIKDPDGKLKIFYIKDVIELRDRRPLDFKYYEFMSTHPNEKHRSKMMPVNKSGTQYFSYIGDGSGNGGGYDESETHAGVIEALSRIKVMTIMVGQEEYEFNLTDIVKTPFLRLGNRHEYYPDLICTFPSTHKLFKRWGGKFAIEVTYTHECSKQKLVDFEFHNIPIFEVVIPKGSPLEFPQERNSISTYTQDDVDNYVKFLYQEFIDHVDAKLITNPMSTEFALEKIRSKNKFIYKQKEEISQLNIEISDLKSIIDNKDKLLAKASDVESKLCEITSINKRQSNVISQQKNELCIANQIRDQTQLKLEESQRKIMSHRQTENDLSKSLDILKPICTVLTIYLFASIAIMLGYYFIM